MLLSVLGATTFVGCSLVPSTQRINVEFEESMQGIQRGDQVYLFGLPVGEVGTPFIFHGRAIVPVSLGNSSVFAQNSQVLFFIAPDQTKPGRQCLVAIVYSVPVEAGQPRFRGFASKTKVVLQMGTEKAESWWKKLGSSN